MRRYRIKAPRTIYHITSRGNGGQRIFHDDPDRLRFLAQLARIIHKMEWHCHSYCLMGNHYHLLMETGEDNLSEGVQWLNGRYAQTHNVRHGTGGHLFQDRFDSSIVDTDEYFMIVASYIVLNPVKAGLAVHPAVWQWSSYLETVEGKAEVDFLESKRLLSLFDDDARTARLSFKEFVESCMEVLLEDGTVSSRRDRQKPRPVRPELGEILGGQTGNRRDRNELILAAYLEHGYCLREIACFLEMSTAGICKIVNSFKEKV